MRGKLTQGKHLNTLIVPGEIIGIMHSDGVDDSTTNYELDELIELRDRLNISKDGLDKFYEQSKRDRKFANQWIQIQAAVDLYKSLRDYVARTYNAQIVTNAWLKYYEIYSHYQLLRSATKLHSEGATKLHSEGATSKPIRAFFNAELPGAALCAFNHYMKTIIKVDYEWVASSLVGASGANDTTALGDTYGLYAANKQHWLMRNVSGNDSSNDSGNGVNNGDATDINNLLDWERRIGSTIDIYSHDAGIDVSDDFNNQELANAKVHLGCALAGFMTLAPGGTFIAKQYTFFETFTWNLILIYASMFEKFYLCKPLTSRPFNSEVYFVGVGFNGMPSHIRYLLIDRLCNFNTTPLMNLDIVEKLHNDNLRTLVAFAKEVYEAQIRFIDENIMLTNKYIGRAQLLKNLLTDVRNKCQRAWLMRYPVKRIATKDYIPSNKT